MPGFHALLSPASNAGAAFEAAMADQRTDSCLTVEELWNSETFRVGFSGHGGYPKRLVVRDDRLILLEGAVYDRSSADVDAALGRLAESFDKGDPLDDQIRDFMRGSDGDFIVVLYSSRRGEFIVFNDRWGRLPCYLCRTGLGVAVSRSVAALLHTLTDIRFDRVAMAEFLMIGHVLGQKTLVRGIERLPPASVVHASIGAEVPKADVRVLLETVFSSQSGASEAEAVERCADTFLRGLGDRVKFFRDLGWRITADVTGGRDSRAIYAGLSRLGEDAEFYSDDLQGSSEREYLPALEAVYGKKVTLQRMEEPTRDYGVLSKLTYLTDCTVNGCTAWQADYKATERRRLVGGTAIRMMGFGGEFIRTVHKSPYGYRSMAELVRDDFHFFLFRRRDVAELLGLNEKELTRCLVGYFDGYPEQELPNQLKHLYFEYYNTVVNAGENRQRRHFWTVVPLWSKGLLDYEMTCLPTSMLTRAFFDRFLERIDERATTAPFFRRGAVHGSSRDIAFDQLKNRLRRLIHGRFVLTTVRALRAAWAGEHRKAKRRSQIDDEILSRITPGAPARLYFDASSVSRVVARRTRQAKKDYLLTLLMYLDEIDRRHAGKIRAA